MFTKSSFLLIYKPNSRRVPRVGRVWLAQAHTQGFETPPRERDVSQTAQLNLALL
jgi:hypothetical protein